ncbi:MAG: hypothetical protein ACP5JE_06130 [Thermoplasmata archaeon]|jgi:hypothetical protein
MNVSWVMAKYFLEKLGSRVYRCKLCGGDIYIASYTEKRKTIHYHFYNGHRDIYLITYRCLKGDLDSCIDLERIKDKYNKEGGKYE